MEATILTQSVTITSILLLAAMLLAFIRLIRGPDAADRIVALDLISVLIVALLAVLAIDADETSFLDV
ncbi:MAG: monovalent cation/H+ antiporter complex subunit F, partial [Desulfobacterales bacterium]